ncbi:MAG: carboxypeptidase-like regulatory domain-containing protein [Candidatus Eisenbacteria bacterium]
MERMLPSRPAWSRGTALLLALLLAPIATSLAQAQSGGANPVTIHVVDQNGQELAGSVVRLSGSSLSWTTPATVDLSFGPQLFIIAPAFQGAMFPGGSALPTAANDLTRDEFLFVDGSPEMTIVWQTAPVTMSVVDQDGAPIPGATWGFAGEGAYYAPGTVLAPITDESVYSTLHGVSRDGWVLAARAAFEGQGIDLTRAEAREVSAATSGLALEWRQSTCAMGVVDAAGVPIRGATWTMFGHTFAAGDAITLPVTDASLYPTLGGALATGIPATLFTNTADGTGNATFSVLADGSLAPAFTTIGSSTYGLRCGVSPFPAVTTGTLDGTVLADGVPRSGVTVTLTDALGATRNAVTGAAGGFVFANVEQGPADIAIALPGGFHAVNPASGQQAATVVAGGSTSVQFTIAADVAPPAVINNPETWNYWRREIRNALRGKGPRSESFADMSENYPQAIFAQFAQAPANPVVVEGVTQVDPDGSGPDPARRLTLAEMGDVVDRSGPSSALDDARRELLVVLLNVVSHRLSLNLVIDGRGTTLDQEIRRLAGMINDGARANDRVASNRGALINAGRAGARHGGTGMHGASEAVAEGEGSEDTAAPAGAAATWAGARTSLTATRAADAGVHLTIALAAAGPATLDLYDVAGRHVARLWEGDAPAGVTAVTWSRGSARPGVYFARLKAVDGVQTAKVIAAQ